jgi:cystathionine gamma-synthase
MDCWLVQRGTKTLPLRMERHSENALRIAQFLQDHPAVERVLYPGLAGHPGHAVARRQMAAAGRPLYGGMISFTHRNGAGAAKRAVTCTRVFILAESLGGVESLIEHPGAMTHASVVGSPLEVPGGLVRLSVGIENVEDLIEDLDQALRRT